MPRMKEVRAVINGTNLFYSASDGRVGLAEYEAARLVINANRRVGTDRRAAAMRKALKQFDVQVSWHPGDINGPIRIYAPSKGAELIITA